MSPEIQNGVSVTLQKGLVSYNFFFFKFIYLIPGSDCSESVNLCQSGETQCTNGGLCIPRSRGFSCQCPFGYHGDRCQSSSKGFSALSYAEYIMTLDSRKNTIGQF